MISAIVHDLVFPPLLALLTSIAVMALLVRTRVAALALDHPNERSLHEVPTPRLGGLGIAAGIAAGWWLAPPPLGGALLIAFGILVAVSLIDDLKTLSVGWRLTLHLACALVAMVALLHPAHGIWLTLTAALATAWMINLYNFMDGSDGLAGGMGFIGFSTYGVAAIVGNDWAFAACNFAVAASVLGFLCFNFPPAKIFMGDAGAIPLGYLAAVLGITGWLRGDWPLWFGAVVFSPFIVDATVTLLKRALRGATIWQAHREHYYQRLVQSGWSHRRTALAEYGLMTCCSVIAITCMHSEPLQIAALVTVPAIYVVLIAVIERSLAQHSGHA